MEDCGRFVMLNCVIGVFCILILIFVWSILRVGSDADDELYGDNFE